MPRILVAHGGHQPAGAAAGKPVLVVEPGLHPLLFGLVDAGSNALHPRLAHVLRAQSDPGVNEKAAEPPVLHHADLSPEFLLIQLVVPRPERRPPKFHAMADLADLLEFQFRRR